MHSRTQTHTYIYMYTYTHSYIWAYLGVNVCTARPTNCQQSTNCSIFQTLLAWRRAPMIRHLVVVVVGVSAAGAPAQTACVDDCLLVLLYAAVAIAIDLTKVIVVVVFVFVCCNWCYMQQHFHRYVDFVIVHVWLAFTGITGSVATTEADTYKHIYTHIHLEYSLRICYVFVQIHWFFHCIYLYWRCFLSFHFCC